MAERAAEIAEKEAFEKIKKRLPVQQVFAQPAGSATNFPDFGFRINVNKKNVDLHFEYKADALAQMGSMRDWVFNGTKFVGSASAAELDPEKEQLLAVMNGTPNAIKEAKRLLGDLKQYYSPKVTNISSGCLGVISDKNERKKQLFNFSTNISSTMIANISDRSLGEKVREHYHKKFHANLNEDADYSVLFFMVGNTIWFVEETGNLDEASKKLIPPYFGATNIHVLPPLVANLEVRISPRPGKAASDPKAFWSSSTNPHIDVMANFRLKQKLSGGVTI